MACLLLLLLFLFIYLFIFFSENKLCHSMQTVPIGGDSLHGLSKPFFFFFFFFICGRGGVGVAGKGRIISSFFMNLVIE